MPEEPNTEVPAVQERLPVLITAALGVVESAFSTCAATIERPLSTVASTCWQKAVHDCNGAVRMEVIDYENLTRSPISGTIYFVPPEAPMPPRMPEESLQEAALEQYLAEHGVRTSRMSVDPVPISLDSPLWTLGGTHPVIEQLYAELMERFTSVVRLLLDSVPPGLENPHILVTLPRLVLATGDTPFAAKLCMDCRCCFYSRKPRVVPA